MGGDGAGDGYTTTVKKTHGWASRIVTRLNDTERWTLGRDQRWW